MFKVKIDPALVQEGIRVTQRLSPSTSGNLTLKSDGQSLFMISASDVSRSIIQIPCQLQGEALFAIPVEALANSTKGRTGLQMVYDKTILTVTNGTNYEVAMATVDAVLFEDDEQQGDVQSWIVEPAILDWLKQAVTKVSLKPTSQLTPYMPVSVRITEKGAFVSCYDDQHMAFMRSRDIKGKLDVTLPIETLSAILDTFLKLKCKITVSETSLRIRNKLMDVLLALPEKEGQQGMNVEDVIAMAREVQTSNGTMIKMSKKIMTEFLSSARSVATKERMEIRVKAAKGQAKFGVETSNGTIKDDLSVAIRGRTKFAVDYEFFDEAVRKCKDDVPFKVVGDAFLTFDTGESTIAVSLNQEDGGS